MAAKIDTEDLITCPICFEQFTDPKCLPCLHTFCHPCMKSYIIAKHGGEGKKAKNFPCPVCRQEVTVTDTDVTSEKIAETMPGNHFITSLIDKISDKNQNEKRCGPCNFRNKEITAISWCKNCAEALCENCAYHHEGLRQSNHYIVPLSNMEKEKSAGLLDVDEPCIKHAGKMLEVYCVDHKEMCCVICLATSHRKCEHISTFEEMVTGSKDIESVEQFAENLLEIENETDKLEVKMDENLTTLNDKHDVISQQVTTTVQQAKDKLDHLHSSFMTKLQQVHKQQGVKHSETKERIETFKQNVKKGQKLLKAVREHGSPKQVFITKEKLRIQLRHQMEGLKVELEGVHCIEYELNMDAMVTSILNTLTSLAEVDTKPTLNLCTSLNEISDVVDWLDKKQPTDVMKLEVTKEHSIDPGSEITGGAFLPDGRILLCCFTRTMLEVYDQTWKLLFNTHCKDGPPKDVCLVSPSEIVVSVFGQEYLNKYEIQQYKTKEIGKIPCESGALGLAATKDNIVVGYTTVVDVLSMDGQTIQRFPRESERMAYVAVSMTGRVYYTDGSDVVCKTMDGKEIKRFTNPHLNRLLGIAVDRNGNVYVCGRNSNNVCVFSSDGKNSKMLLTNLASPIHIGLDSSETKLYIGMSTKQCHCDIYNLKET